MTTYYVSSEVGNNDNAGTSARTVFFQPTRNHDFRTIDRIAIDQDSKFENLNLLSSAVATDSRAFHVLMPEYYQQRE
jgi:hypothetical protein